MFDRLAPALALPDDEALMAALHTRAAHEHVALAASAADRGTTAEFPAGVFDELPAAFRDTVAGDAYYPVAVPISALAAPGGDTRAKAAAAAFVVDLMREIYAGTAFDASRDVRAGAFGDPEELPGAPRRISILRTSSWHVVQASAAWSAAAAAPPASGGGGGSAGDAFDGVSLADAPVRAIAVGRPLGRYACSPV